MKLAIATGLLILTSFSSAAEVVTIKYGCKARQFFETNSEIVKIWQLVKPNVGLTRLAVNYSAETGELNPDLTFLFNPEVTSVSVLRFGNEQIKETFKQVVSSLPQPHYGTCSANNACFESVIDVGIKVMTSINPAADCR